MNISEKGLLLKPLISIAILVFLSIGAFLIVSQYYINDVFDRIEKQYRQGLISIVSVARNSVEPVLKKVRSGEITPAEAIEIIRPIIRAMTYEDQDGKNYIFMSTQDGLTLVQPYALNQELKNRLELRDVKGVFILKELINASKMHPEGSFVRYHYPHFPDNEIQEKLSYVIGLPEINCYIASGMYIERMINEQREILTKVKYAAVLLFVAVLLPIIVAVIVINNRNRLLLAEVSSRREAAEAMLKSEEKYRYLFENAIEGLFQTSIDGRFLSASPAMARILGYNSTEELISQVTNIQAQVYVNPEDREAIISSVLESKEVIEKEIQIYRRDKRPIWVSLNIRAMLNQAGEVIFLHGFVIDITERKRAEEEIRKLNEELEVRVSQRTMQLEAVNAKLKDEIAERRQIEDTLKYRLKFENLIAGISIDIAGLTIDQLDFVITEALKDVTLFAGADRGYVALLTDDGKDMSLTHRWDRESMPHLEDRGSGATFLPRLGWLRDQIEQHEPIRLVTLDDLPMEAAAEKEYWEAQATRACVILPLVCGGILKGFLGFDSLHQEWKCPDDLLGLLRTASLVFAIAVDQMNG